MKWNERQRQAIEERGKNIIVSAAAGSGKTAVLVERILRLIIEENTRVDELLVVTFTKAAAAEMKERIAKAIKNKIKETGESGENLEFLKEQLDLLGQASISTFHSFAMNIIKNYYYVADISPDLKTADETQVAIMKINAIEQVFAEEFDRDDNKDFIRFMNHYSSHKTENGIKESLLKTYEKIMAMEEPFKWLHEKVEVVQKYDDKDTVSRQAIFPLLYNFYRKEVERLYYLKNMIKDILEENGIVLMAEKQSKDVEKIKKVLELLDSDVNIENLRDAIEAVSNIKFTQLRATKEEKEEYNLIKDQIDVFKTKASDKLKEMKNLMNAENFEKIFADIKETYPYLKEIEHLLISLHEKYSQMKLDKNVMDFNDMEHYALEILANEQVAKECRNRYKYIFVDEYQDSNYIQEAIIARIKRVDNLFVVGDLKQSIYSFRLAEPDIFRARYKEYQIDEHSIKIDLNQNFRCKKNIIDGVNHVFKNCMDDYDDNAKLYKGVSNEEQYDFPVKMLVCEENFDEMENEAYTELLEFKKVEMEAAAVAREIKDIVGKTVIYDSKSEVERVLEYRDIVILIRSVKSVGDVFQNILSKEGIPVFLNNNGGYFETTEITLLLNLLTAIDNPMKDIPLISVMYSCVFNFTIDELMSIRNEKRKGTFYSAVINYTENGTISSLKDKTGAMISKLKKWKSEGNFKPLDEFVWNVIQTSGIYLDAGLKNGGIQRQLNLRTFVDKTKVYLSLGENSIYGLLNYFEMVKSNIETGPVSLVAKEEDTVQITTIHKSKGLEYPVVIIPSMNKNFMGKNRDGIVSINRKLGIALKTYAKENGAIKDNILVKMIENLRREDMREEEIRILYVGMTRAKDMLIMVGNVKDSLADFEKIKTEIEPKTYLECSLVPALEHPETFKVQVKSKDVIFENLSREESIREHIAKVKKQLNTQTSEQAMEAIDQKMRFQYPYVEEFKIKSKYGVTELNRKNEIYNDNEIIQPDFMIDQSRPKKTMVNVHYGNIYHTAMEWMDFSKAAAQGKAYVEELIEQLKETGRLTDEEVKVLSPAKLLHFIESPVGKRAAASKACYKERQFTMKHQIDGHDTLVQGVIDCYFEEDNGFVLIDYKTGKNKKESTENYKIQVQLYREAIEKATGKTVKEGWLYFFGDDESLKVF